MRCRPIADIRFGVVLASSDGVTVDQRNAVVARSRDDVAVGSAAGSLSALRGKVVVVAGTAQGRGLLQSLVAWGQHVLHFSLQERGCPFLGSSAARTPVLAQAD